MARAHESKHNGGANRKARRDTPSDDGLASDGKKRVLILRTGNSARSRMAEGDEAARLAVSRRARDEIGARLREFIAAA